MQEPRKDFGCKQARFASLFGLMGVLPLTVEGFGEDEPEAPATKYTKDKAFTILRNYLQLDTSQSEDQAAQNILVMIPDETSSGQIWEFGEMCFELAEQIPYNHPAQIRLTRLLERMGTSTKIHIIFKDEKVSRIFDKCRVGVLTRVIFYTAALLGC